MVVTSPQQLVGMIVEKAVHMAGLMNIPVLALVENMSYVACPQCGTVIHPSARVPLKRSQANTASTPLPNCRSKKDLSQACDGGCIELFEGDWLNGLADKLEAIVKKEKA